MILPAQKIAMILPIPFEPFCPRTVDPVTGFSYGLSSAGYDIRIAQDVTMRPGDFELVSSLEKFIVPRDIMQFVKDKSSWARMGLAVQNTVIEPGWRGYLTLELTNHGRNTLFIEKGAPIAQIIFHRLEAPTIMPYNGKYQDQDNRPVAAISERV